MSDDYAGAIYDCSSETRSEIDEPEVVTRISTFWCQIAREVDHASSVTSGCPRPSSRRTRTVRSRRRVTYPAQQAHREQQLRERLAANPDDVAGRFELARILESFERYSEAEATLLDAKAQRPAGDKDVFAALLAFYNRRGNVDAAVALLKERAALDPTPTSPLHRGGLLLGSGAP